MATLESIAARVRLEIGDQATAFNVVRQGDGVSRRFELPNTPVDARTLRVMLEPADGGPGQILLPGDDYALDAEQGLLTTTIVPSTTQLVTVQGQSFRYFTAEQLDLFITTAVAQHLHNRAITLATLPVVEEYPVALLAAIEALYALLNDAAFDIDVSTPEGVGIPRSQRFRQLQEMIELRKQQYAEMSAALNVGLSRIEVFSLRRVSRTTGRLVPVYMPQEIEDRQPATRVYAPIDTHGGPVINDPTPVHDIEMFEYGHFTLDLEALGDLNGWRIEAKVRRYEDGSSIREMTVLVRDLDTGALTLEMNPRQTGHLPPRLFWDLRLTNRQTREVRTLRKGRVTVIQQVGVDEAVGTVGHW